MVGAPTNNTFSLLSVIQTDPGIVQVEHFVGLPFSPLLSVKKLTMDYASSRDKPDLKEKTL